MQQLLTLDEAAQVLRLHRLTVRRYITTGLLPAAKMGRAWRIRQDDLLAFIEGRKQTPAEPTPPPGETR